MRYSRQEVLEHIGKEGQKKLQESSASIVGIGAIGTVASELLARAGIGNLRLIDRDIVDLTNLQRQSLYTEDDLGRPKAIQAQKHLQDINSDITIEAHAEDLIAENIHEILGNTNVILDGTDNLATRFLINDYARKYGIPWIYAAAIKDTGYVLPLLPGSFCFCCVFKEAKQLETCDTVGVLNTITHLIAAIEVTEALKILLRKPVGKELLKVNIWNPYLERYTVQKNPGCAACKGIFEHLTKQESDILKVCGSHTYQIRTAIDLKGLKKRLEKTGKVEDFAHCLKFGALTIFRNRVLVSAASEKEARILFAKYIGD